LELTNNTMTLHRNETLCQALNKRKKLLKDNTLISFIKIHYDLSTKEGNTYTYKKNRLIVGEDVELWIGSDDVYLSNEEKTKIKEMTNK
jgi:hypothetical protein